LKRRKEIYEAKYPETKQHIAGGKKRQGSASDMLSFASDTAAKINTSPRTVQHEIQIADKIAPDATFADREYQT
jgi:ParB family chromosome partitioning protein